MRFTVSGILIAIGLIAAIVLLLYFGFSDFFVLPPSFGIWETKPWRPWLRLIFSFIMIGLLIGGVGVFLKVKYRAR